MSLAWGTLSLILLVLPGFATLFGFYSHSRLSGQLRDVTPKSQAGEIAMVVFLAFCIHMSIMLAAGLAKAVVLWLPSFIPSFDLHLVEHLTRSGRGFKDFLVSFGNDCLSNQINSGCMIGSMAAKNFWSIMSSGVYIILTSLIGFILGSLFIKAIEERWFGIKIKRFHSWSYDLITGPEKPAIQVDILTSIKVQGKEVEYRGTLDQMTLDAEQKITAVLLKNTTAYFADDKLAKAGLADAETANSLLVVRDQVLIPGPQIVNISYDPLDFDREGVQSLQAALQSLPETEG